MKTTVIHVRDMRPGDVYVGRNPRYRRSNPAPVHLGNQYRIGTDGTREEVIEKFRKDFLRLMERYPLTRADVIEMKGKRLACHCHPLPCHGDVIAEWLDGQP